MRREGAKRMKHIDSLEALEGKTIKKIHNSLSEVIIAFTDNSFCFFEGEYDGEITTVNIARYYDKKWLFLVDLISHDEYRQFVAEEDKRQEDAERKRYEALKARFGD